MASSHLTGLIAAATLVGATASCIAQGTEAQREACTPDAFRLCVQAMPDPGRVESCLRNAGPQLSAACYNVFYPPEATTQGMSVRGQRPPRNRLPVQLSPPQLDDED